MLVMGSELDKRRRMIQARYLDTYPSISGSEIRCIVEIW